MNLSSPQSPAFKGSTVVKIQTGSDSAGTNKKLLKSRQNAGSYTIIFDAADIPTGTYYHTRTANNYSCLLKLTLLK